ncbi:ABC transporter permease subunit [Treponema sp. J25]|jgi:putative aldouronate transport system permease protein|uniref:ABC transporter permease n=1 Tax=Treponema sp. J25 TaxID=2094121 RepID=UPI001051A880|nr:ABC transporter permease subunit [Treponema sp. J25]
MKRKTEADLYLMLIPGITFYFIFKYIPLYGILMAFKDYNFMIGVFKSPWVGLDVFKEVFRDSEFWRALTNTIRLNVLSLCITFPLPILFALLLNEINNEVYKKTIQSISYLPHFISWVILYGLILSFTAKETGLINVFLRKIGAKEIAFLGNEFWWTVVYILSGIWKDMGWAAIIYLAALSTIDPALYEAASIDGANRLHKMWYITLPGIKGTIVVILILQIGKIMTIGFEQPYLLGNALVARVSTVLSTFIYERGLLQAQFSFTTAVGLIQSIVNFVFLLGADYVARFLGEKGIFMRDVK